MANAKVIILTLCFGMLLHQSIAANILVVFPHIYYSHFKATSTLVKALSSSGHAVTFVSPYPGNLEGYGNVTEISIDGIIEPMKNLTNEFLENNRDWYSYWSKLKYAKTIGYEYTKQILENKNITNLINSNSPFDLVIIEDVSADGLAIFSHIFRCPLVVLLSEPGSVFYDNYISDTILWKQLNDLRNGHHWAIKELYREWSIFPSQNMLIKKIVPSAPDLRKILYQTSLVLMPSYSTLGNLMPKYPNVKQIGGFHLGISGQLSPKLEPFFNGSKHGVIVISNNLPNNVKSDLGSFLVGEMFQNILFTSDAAEVIGHPKVKLFIGDGDVYDTSLAVLNQVPVLSISNNRWNEQFLINSLEEKVIAAQVSGEDIGSWEFIRIRHQMLTNTSYKHNLRLASEIIQLNEKPPLDEAIFWIEYVIRFNGAPHLRTDKLEWSIQNHLVTIIIVLVIVDIALFLLFYWIITHLLRICLYCEMKIYDAGRVLFKRDRSTVGYIKM